MSILDRLKEHNKKEKSSFHMPGHKSGRALIGTELDYTLWKFDTTELSDTDCLLNPTDIIKRAEEKAAEVYGAKNSFFLVNGASCGILAMFYAAFREGDKVIVCRDCHRSVINAMILSGIVPVYADPIIHEKGFSCGVDVQTIKNILKKNSDVKGIFITSPTYFGTVSDVKEIANIAHESGALLLCDEAHGAHFPFSDIFPEGAVACGADISVVSLHKSMPCPNQSAILNLGNCRISQQKMRQAVNMFQTTSPSYVLMGAMENALDIGINRGKKFTEKILKYKPKSEFIYSFDDAFKIILDFTKKGYTGFEVSEILEKKYGIFVEMSTQTVVLLMISWGNTKKDFLLLKKAITYIDSLPDRLPVILKDTQMPGGNCVKSPREVFYGEKEKILLDDAVGHVAAQEITIFPPCIPVFMLGEEIKSEHIEIINNAKNLNLTVTGIEDDSIFVLKKDI